MIPEAIAIVCAPSYDEIGTFILTPNYGMKEIADCSKSGFHPHTNNPPLFEVLIQIVLSFINDDLNYVLFKKRNAIM
jgi:hypothetical protein